MVIGISSIHCYQILQVIIRFGHTTKKLLLKSYCWRISRLTKHRRINLKEQIEWCRSRLIYTEAITLRRLVASSLSVSITKHPIMGQSRRCAPSTLVPGILTTLRSSSSAPPPPHPLVSWSTIADAKINRVSPPAALLYGVTACGQSIYVCIYLYLRNRSAQLSY